MAGRREAKDNGVVDERALCIPPIAKCAMDGAPVDRLLVEEEQTTAKANCEGSSLALDELRGVFAALGMTSG